MFVIGVYDIATIDKSGRSRLPKVMKAMRKYLHHSQKSVFEGEITDAKFAALQTEIQSLINNADDYVVFFKVPGFTSLERVNIGKNFDPNINIL